MRNFATAVAVSMLLATGASAATITTLADEDSSIIYWGLPDTSAYGQTFTLAAGGIVNAVTFRINDGGTVIDFLAYLFSWDGSKTSGAALSSVSGSTTGTNAMTSITASLGDIAVAAGQYVAFFQATSAGAAAWGSTTSVDYAGGAFVFQNNNGDETQFGTVDWSGDWQGQGSDLAFEVTYDVAAVPVPAALPLLVGGLGLLGAAARRRRS